MRKSVFVLSLFATASFASSDVQDCEFTLKQNRDQSFQSLSLAALDKDGSVKDSYRDFQFGLDFKNELSEKNITKLCAKEDFRNHLTEVLNCTNDLYDPVSPEVLSKKQIGDKKFILSHRSFTMSKWSLFSYCLKNKNELGSMGQDIALTKSCLEGIQSRLQFNEVLGIPGESVFKMERNHDELLGSCQTPLFRKAFINTDMQTVSDCYKQKMTSEKLANTFSFEGVFNSLLNESRAKNAKVETKLSLKQWQDEIAKEHLFDDYVAPAVKTYTYCSDSFLKGREVYSFYKNQDFVNCLYNQKENSTADSEAFCAGESLLMAEQRHDSHKASRSIASDEESEQSFFGQWQNSQYNSYHY